jgi:hypothetical protein
LNLCPKHSKEENISCGILDSLAGDYETKMKSPQECTLKLIGLKV